MSEFVGRTGSRRVYSYPEPRFTALVGPFARNSAFGPSGEGGTPVTSTGTAIPWAFVEVPGVNSATVPITPKATGIVRALGVVMVTNTSSTTDAEVQVQINFAGGSPNPVPAEEDVIIPPGGSAAIPIDVVITDPPLTPLGNVFGLQILVTASGVPDNTVELLAASSTFDLQEVSAPTG